MFFKIPDVLNPDELQSLRENLSQAEFADGKLTAGWHAKLVKNNQQLKRNAPECKNLKQLVIKALQRHALFQSAVRPKVIHSILFSRYDRGMSYGSHVDNAIMGEGVGWRSDVSFTLFLSAPSEYEGGELVLQGADDERAIKLDSGAAIVYPSTTLHRVNPVMDGSRLVVVGWVQSYIRDDAEREILFELDTARRSLFAQHGKTPEFDLISKSVANLLRKWAEV